jgi:flagellar protein FliS
MNMSANQIARQYRELAVKGATPVGLIILLYDLAIESLSGAARKIEAGDIEGRTDELNHALAVISELQRSLNFEAGGDVAKRLTDLYDVARTKILEANIKSSKEIVDRLSGVLCSIREAWQMVERQSTAQPAPEHARIVQSPVPASPAQSDNPNSPLQWNA